MPFLRRGEKKKSTAHFEMTETNVQKSHAIAKNRNLSSKPNQIHVCPQTQPRRYTRSYSLSLPPESYSLSAT